MPSEVISSVILKLLSDLFRFCLFVYVWLVYLFVTVLIQRILIIWIYSLIKTIRNKKIEADTAPTSFFLTECVGFIAEIPAFFNLFYAKISN